MVDHKTSLTRKMCEATDKLLTVLTTLSHGQALSLGGNFLARKAEKVAAPLPVLQGVQDWAR